ncbi:MAG TPA: glucose-1-phosphate thymidylyltransferase [Dehalococcoidia bacterium]|jgi:glucose-1-phosphate thymidylyltransferase
MGGSLKGLVLVGGKALRLRPLTYTGAKQLVPIANRPILFYAIDQLVEAGVTDLCFVISPETGDQVRDAVGDGSSFGAVATYVTQPEPRGIADGIRLGRERIGDAPFVTFLGDNFLAGGIGTYAAEFLASDAQAGVLLKHVPDPSSLGVAEFEGERLVRVIEKPANPPSDLAVIGIYFFRPGVFEAIAAIAPSKRGELEVTDAIQWLIDAGRPVRADVVEGEWIDTGKHDDLLAANRLILERLVHDVKSGEIDERSQLHGRVVLQQGARVLNSIISGPAIIGERTVVENSYVGPFTSIGPDCRIIESEIAGSVVMERTVIENLGHRIDHSLIGRNVELRSGDRKPRSFQIVLGDFSKLQVP